MPSAAVISEEGAKVVEIPNRHDQQAEASSLHCLPQPHSCHLEKACFLSLLLLWSRAGDPPDSRSQLVCPPWY